MPSSLPQISDPDVVKRFIELDTELGFLNLLRGLNSADKEVSENKNVILIFSENSALEIKSFRDSTDALRTLFQLEKENPGKDIVLVRADSGEEIRLAFKNYFSDAQDFIELIDKGCTKLIPEKMRRVKKSSPKVRSKQA